jgi:hypothetical protein
MEPSKKCLPSPCELIHQLSDEAVKFQNIQEPEFQELPLIDLPENQSRRLLAHLIEKGLFSEDGFFLKNIPLPKLNEAGIGEVHSFLSNLALQQIAPSFIDLFISPKSAIRLCGPGIFKIFGEKYIAEALKEQGIDIYSFYTKEQLNQLCKRSSYLEIKIDLKGAQNSKLVDFGKKIASILKAAGIKIHDDLEKKQCYDVGYDRYYDFTISHNNVSTKITIIGLSSTFSCSDTEDIFLPLSVETLLSLDRWEDIDNISLSEFTMRPEGLWHDGWRALILHLTSLWTVDKIMSLNMKGLIHHFVSLTCGKTALNPEIEQKLPELFTLSLQRRLEISHPKATPHPKTVDEEFFEELSKQFTAIPEALTATIFNILTHLPENLDNRAKHKEKILSLLNQLPTVPWVGKLKSLLESNSLPENVIQAIFVIQASLLECRKKFMGQESSISATAVKSDHKKVCLVAFHEIGITFQLPMDFQTALLVLADYCKKNPNSSKNIPILCEQFYQGIELKHPKLTPSHNTHEINTHAINNLVSLAEDLLNNEAARLIVFPLVCQCGFDLKNEIYLPILCKTLPAVLGQSDTPSQRIVILRHFLQYLEVCFPDDNLFQDRETLDGLLQTLAIPYLSPEQVHSEVAKALAYSSNPDLAEAMLSICEKFSEKDYIVYAEKLIAGYLTRTLSRPALSTLGKLATKKLVHYKRLDALFYRIYNSYIYQPKAYLILDLLRLENVALALLKKFEGEAVGQGFEVYFEIVSHLIQNNYLPKAAALLEEIAKTGAAKSHSLSLFNMHLRLSVAFFNKKEWKPGFDHWLKAKVLYLKFVGPSDPLAGKVLVGELITTLLAVNPKELDVDMAEAHRNLLIEAAINELPESLAEKVFHELTEAYSDCVENKNFTGLFTRIGSWLLRETEAHLKKNALHKQHEELKIYFETPQNMKPGTDERSIADSIFGPHCFKEFITQRNPQHHLVSLTTKIITMADELLSSTSIEVQACGLILLSQSNGKESIGYLKQMINSLPDLLASADCSESKPMIINKFCEYVNTFAPHLILPEQLKKLNPNFVDSLAYQNFCEVFSTATDPQLTSDAVFAAWKKISFNNKVTASLINIYQNKHPELALKILAEQAKQGSIQAGSIENCWGLILKLYKTALNQLSQKELLYLVEIALGIIPKVTHNKTGFKNREGFAVDLCWIMEQLQGLELGSEALKLYEAGNSQKLFAKTSKDSKKLWINLCIELLKENKKPYALCNELLSKDSTQTVDLLGKILHSAKEIDEPLLEILLKGLSSISHDPEALTIAKNIIKYFSEKTLNQISTGQQQLWKTHLSMFINIIKDRFANKDVAASELLTYFLCFLPKISLDIPTVVNEEKLWPYLHKIDVDESLCTQLIKTPNKAAKEKSLEKAEFFFNLAQNRPDTTLTCLELALSALPGGVKLEKDRFNLLSDCLKSLLKDGDYKKAHELLNKLEILQIDLPQEWLNSQWHKLFTLSLNDPIMAAKILIDKQKWFVAIDPLLESKITAISQLLISHDQPSYHNLALKIADLYRMTDTFFWQKALGIGLKNKMIRDEILSILNKSSISFTGTNEDCEKCWRLLFENFSEPSNTQKMPSIVQYAKTHNFGLGVKDPEFSEFRIFLLSVLVENFSSVVSQNEEMEIIQLFSHIYIALAPVYLTKDQDYRFSKLHTRIIEIYLSRKNETTLHHAVDLILAKISTVEIALDIYSSLVDLSQNALNQFLFFGLSRKNDIAQKFEKLIFIIGEQSFPLISRLKFKMLQPDESLYQLAYNLASSNEIDISQFNDQIKEQIINYLFFLACTNEDDKFDKLFSKFERMNIFSKGEKSRLMAVKLKNELQVCPKFDKDSKNDLLFKTLGCYSHRIPQISTSADEVLDCHKLAGDILLDLFEKNPKALFIDQFLQLLTPLLGNNKNILTWKSTVNLAYSDAKKTMSPLHPEKTLGVVRESFDFLNNKCLGMMSISDLESNQNTIDLDSHMHHFFSTFVNTLLNVPSQTDQDQFDLLIYTYFFLKLYVKLFPQVKNMENKLFLFSSRCYNIDHIHCIFQYNSVIEIFGSCKSNGSKIITIDVLHKLPPAVTRSAPGLVTSKGIILSDERKDNYYYAFESLLFIKFEIENGRPELVDCLIDIMPCVLKANSEAAISYTWALIEELLFLINDHKKTIPIFMLILPIVNSTNNNQHISHLKSIVNKLAEKNPLFELSIFSHLLLANDS